MSSQQITDIVLAIFSALTAFFAARCHAANAAKLATLAEDHADLAADVGTVHTKVANVQDQLQGRAE